jgi:hypothetical protein
MIRNPMTIDEIRAMPASVPLAMACRALGIGVTKGYGLARRDTFPVRLLPVGNAKYRAPKSAILEYLGISEMAPSKAVAA